jgi:hypothetical protein
VPKEKAENGKSIVGIFGAALGNCAPNKNSGQARDANELALNG